MTGPSSGRLAIEGGTPVRKSPLPLEFPGIHHMDEEEVAAAVAVLRARSPFRYYGVAPRHETEQLEAELAAHAGTRHALAVSSGTGALHVALSALGVGPGQEVVIPAYLWVAVAAAVVNHGAIPVLADIDDTFCLDPAAAERAISPRTRGLVLVHMSGAPGDAPALAALAQRRGLFLIEDCAQCNGGTIGGRSVGSFGDLGTFSFQMNKAMTAGEGGAVVTSDTRLYRRVEASHDLGYARDEAGRLLMDGAEVNLWGRGYRMDELRAAVLRVQLRKLSRIVAAMRAAKTRLRAALADFPEVRLRRLLDPAGDTGAFLITTYPSAALARRVQQALVAEGIATEPQGINNIVMTDWGLHLYYNIPSLVGRRGVDANGSPWTLAENREAAAGRSYGRGACPVADDLFARSVLLAIPSCLTAADVDDIIAAFRKVLPVCLDRRATPALQR